MRMHLLSRPCLVALAVYTTAPAVADVSLRVRSNQGMESTIHVSHQRCRIEATGISGYTLINTTERSLTHVDPGKGEYSILTEAELRERLAQVDKVRASIAPHMDSLRDGLQMLSPERRAMFEQFMAGQAAPAAGAPVKVVADRGIQHFAGLPCARHHLLRNGREVGDTCLVQQPGGVLSREDFSTLETVFKLLRQYSAQAGSLLATAGNKSALLQPGISGIPLALRDYTSGESYRVVEASNRSLDDSLFSAYRKYRRTEVPAIPGLF